MTLQDIIESIEELSEEDQEGSIPLLQKQCQGGE